MDIVLTPGGYKDICARVHLPGQSLHFPSWGKCWMVMVPNYVHSRNCSQSKEAKFYKVDIPFQRACSDWSMLVV